MLPHPPISPLFPYTTLFRSAASRTLLPLGGMMAGLKYKYCIVGVGETEYSRISNRSTRAMAVEAIKKAMADAGLKAADVDGMRSEEHTSELQSLRHLVCRLL